MWRLRAGVVLWFFFESFTLITLLALRTFGLGLKQAVDGLQQQAVAAIAMIRRCHSVFQTCIDRMRSGELGPGTTFSLGACDRKRKNPVAGNCVSAFSCSPPDADFSIFLVRFSGHSRCVRVRGSSTVGEMNQLVSELSGVPEQVFYLCLPSGAWLLVAVAVFFFSDFELGEEVSWSGEG